MKKKIVGIISGIHRNEQNAIANGLEFEALFQDKLLEFANIELKFLNGVNKIGIYNNSRFDEVKLGSKKFPIDLNRQFGKDFIITEDGEINISIPSIEKCKSFIDECDFIIDLHNSPNCRTCILLDSFNNEKNKFIKNTAFFSRIPYTKFGKEKGTLKAYTNSLEGKIAFTLEMPGMNYSSKENYNSKLMEILVAINEFANTKDFPDFPDFELHTFGKVKEEKNALFLPTKNIQNLIYPKDFVVGTLYFDNPNKPHERISRPVKMPETGIVLDFGNFNIKEDEDLFSYIKTDKFVTASNSTIPFSLWFNHIESIVKRVGNKISDCNFGKIEFEVEGSCCQCSIVHSNETEEDVSYLFIRNHNSKDENEETDFGCFISTVDLINNFDLVKKKMKEKV